MMADFEVKKHENSSEEYWKTFKDIIFIQTAVEKAASQFCAHDDEYHDFECFARQVGESEWQAFNVEVQWEPVFYATKAQP